MRDLNQLNHYRMRGPEVQKIFGHDGDSKCGAFMIRSKFNGMKMQAIASTDDGWDHVSVSRRNKIPSWMEMCQIKHLFFEPWEIVMQLHVADKDHISIHDNCLHLWRPTGELKIPCPPSWMV